MSNRRLMLGAMSLFVLVALPFLMAQPNAAATAGLSLGFTAPLAHGAMLALLVLVGMCAALLPRDGLLLLPVAFTLMLMIGGALALDVAHYPALRYFILGAIVCMTLLVGIARERLTVLTVLILASLGFHLGGYYMQAVPSIAAPMYYLIGVLASLSMVLGIAVAFGVTLAGDAESTWERIRQSPRFLRICSIFS